MGTGFVGAAVVERSGDQTPDTKQRSNAMSQRLILPLVTPAGRSAAPAATPPPPRPLALSEAIASALERNDAILVQREAVIAADAARLRAKGAYDPGVDVQADYRRVSQ